MSADEIEAYLDSVREQHGDRQFAREQLARGGK